MNPKAAAALALLCGVPSSTASAHSQAIRGGIPEDAAEAAAAPIVDEASPRATRGAKSPNSSIKEQLDAKTDLRLDGCRYDLSFSFQHDDALPSKASGDCRTREFYFQFPANVYKETGFAGLGLDYRPCGHPPVGAFTIEHYDIHFYTSPIKERPLRTCKQVEGRPTCDPEPGAQTTNSGRAFFNVATVRGSNTLANMPANFECDWEKAVPANMGTHCKDPATVPASTDDWVEPVLIMGAYDGGIAFFEPMAPLDFLTGDVDREFVQEVEYEGQTIATLPFRYSVVYNAATSRSTTVLSGVRSRCGEDI